MDAVGNGMARAIVRLNVAIVISMISVSADAFQNPTFHYQPARSELTGSVNIEKHYGPPNYGEDPESDSVEAIYVLTLVAPISIVANKNDPLNASSFENVTRIQLTSGDIKLSPLVGNAVRVSGELFQGNTGHHHTDVLMWVESTEIRIDDQSHSK